MNDVVLALYSDRLFMAAVGVYVLAMVLHAAEYAAARAARPVEHDAPLAVGAGAPGAVAAVGGAGASSAPDARATAGPCGSVGPR